MFRRHKSETTTSQTAVELTKVGGKGRPTPTRRDAQAAARERARVPLDKKEASRKKREQRSASGSQMRQAMKSGDERYLPARDQGPVRRFIRDFIDTRLAFAELLLPLLIAIMILGYSGNDALARFGNGLWLGTILLVAFDTIWLRFRLRRELRRRFPDESHKGTTFYAVLRALQLRFLRMPKPQVKLGNRLPDRY